MVPPSRIQVAENLCLVGVIQHDAVIAVADRHVVAHRQLAGEHQRVADMISNRDITGHHAFIGVHVVDSEPQIAEPIVAEDVVAAGIDEDAIPAEANIVAVHDQARGIPHIDAVAAIVHAQIIAADDRVAPGCGRLSGL